MGNDRQFRLLCDYIGQPAMADDARFATAGQRSVNRAVLKPLLEQAFSQRDGQELADALMAIGVPAAPVLNVEQALHHPAHRPPRDGGEDGRLPGPGRAGEAQPHAGQLPLCAAGRGQGFHVTDGCTLLPGPHVRGPFFYACDTGKGFTQGALERVVPRIERLFTTKTTTPHKETPTMQVELKVNGKPVSAYVPPNTLLVQLLREHLRLTGTHVGCHTAQCGACTVMADGRAIKSCNVLALQIQGADITTVEGLAQADGTLHPVQAAFKECHGLQCGFVSPAW